MTQSAPALCHWCAANSCASDRNTWPGVGRAQLSGYTGTQAHPGTVGYHPRRRSHGGLCPVVTAWCFPTRAAAEYYYDTVSVSVQCSACPALPACPQHAACAGAVSVGIVCAGAWRTNLAEDSARVHSDFVSEVAPSCVPPVPMPGLSAAAADARPGTPPPWLGAMARRIPIATANSRGVPSILHSCSHPKAIHHKQQG